jgi:hypothetical protein
MKAFYLKSLLTAAIAVTLSSCEKNAETIETLSEKQTKSVSKVVYPLLGNEMSTSILPKKDTLSDGVLEKGFLYKYVKFKLINEVCEEYLKDTKLLDISKLPEGEYGNTISNDELTLKFVSTVDAKDYGFKKVSSGSQGWWAHWNYSPYTESEYPAVLLGAYQDGEIQNVLTFTFSKKLQTFGFEVAPNELNKNMTVRVKYWDDYWYKYPNLCEVVQTVSTPSGARLIAIKSGVPIRRVEIILGLYPNDGVAISNLRYEIAK